MPLQGPPVDPSIRMQYVVLAHYRKSNMVIGPFESKSKATTWAQSNLPTHPMFPTREWTISFFHEP